jgi:S-adenosylmethionine/arginine decarboxylase-like enzyme
MFKQITRKLSMLNPKVPWGFSTSLDLKNCNNKIRDKNDIQNFVYQLCDLIEMKRFGDCRVVHFGTGNKSGYSMVQLIETSNITGHFCDENNSAYIDIFSCKPYNEKEMQIFTTTFFEAESCISKTTLRY